MTLSLLGGLQDPGVGSNAGLEDLKSKLTTQGEDVTTIRSQLTSIREGRLSVWDAPSGAAWDTDVAELETSFQPVVTAHSAVNTAISAYIIEVNRIRTEFLGVAGKFNSAEEILARPVPKRNTLLEDSIPGMKNERLRKQSEHNQAVTDRNAAIATNDVLMAERAAADAALASAINGAMPPTWNATYSALKKAGVKDFSDLTSADIAEVLQGYISKAQSDDGLSQDDIAVLMELLGCYADDPSVMGKIVDDLGGEGIADLLWKLEQSFTDSSNNRDSPRPEQLAQLGGLIRQAVATASQGWNGKKAHAFSEGLFSDKDKYGVIGFLFDGPPYLGKSLAIEAADFIDEYERVNSNHTFTYRSNLAIHYDNYFRSSESGKHEAFDLAGRIFETLGQYPLAAAEFLSPSGKVDTDRINYWFGERSWSLHDGFAGPGALLAGSQRIPGGPGDFTNPANVEAYRRAAEIAGSALVQLAENNDWDKFGPSDAGAAWVAAALGAQMPGLIETIFGEAGGAKDYDLVFKSDVQGLFGAEMTFAFLTDAQLKMLLGRVGDHSGGAEILQTATDSYAARLLNQYVLSNTPELAAVMSRIAAAQAAIDGSTAGTQIRDAAQSDTASRRDIELISKLFGAVPMPGWAAADITFGLLLDAATDQIIANQTGQEAALAAEQHDAQGERKTAIQVALAMALWNALPAGDKAGIPDPSKVTDQEAWLEDYKGSLNLLISPKSGFSLYTLAESYKNTYEAYK